MSDEKANGHHFIPLEAQDRAEKCHDADDPMELVGMVLPGTPETLDKMAETIVDEYVRLGWDERRLMTLFVNPMFMATYRIYQEKGEAYVRDLIARVCARWRIEE